MNYELLYIIWNPSEIAFHLGPVAVRWYGLCWLVGIVAGLVVMRKLYKDQKIDDNLFDLLFVYSFIGILVGARLGHCLFYEPDYFLSSGRHIIEMLLPIRFDDMGGWHFTGYAGLASHGGMIGITAALWLYSRKAKLPFVKVVDMIGIAGPLTGAFIRLGNLMNSEIIGRATDMPWAFIFAQVDAVPRHPGQLYEAIAYLLTFLTLWGIYRVRKHWIGSGFYIGLTLVMVFTARFFIEFLKEVQVDFESAMTFDMGQLLSLPFVVLGIWFMIRSRKHME